MALAFQVVNVPIPSGKGRRNIGFESTPFASRVMRANVALNGFKLQYDGAGVDHHIRVIEVDADFATIDGAQNKVVFTVQCDYADKNGDDAYSGSAQVLVIAEVA
jgi:hypothetical protein